MSEGRLPDDCFALPPGVDWTPVDTALDFLKANLACVAGTESIPVGEATGRILASPVIALRPHPAATNSAVDGYGFAYAALGEGEECRLKLAEGRSAAGQPFGKTLPPGHALKVLTGAVLPRGVDSVVLEESVLLEGGDVLFRRPKRQGMNTRQAGEDIKAGDRLFEPGHRLGARDIGHLIAAGIETVKARKRLRVGVLSTGAELRTMVDRVADQHVLDANRPMLLAAAREWGFEPVDLGIVTDDREMTGSRLAGSLDRADVIVTTGGVSSGEEDHVSKLLAEEASLNTWRVAIKPGRPLALAVWRGKPVFGLPGNPVAAFVCSLIFVLPALCLLAGGKWHQPQGFTVPAAFEKNKKAGRREFIRARLNQNGEAELFRSEGSGLTTGLAWSDGLVELDDGPIHIRRSDPVRYLPYSSFGL